MRQYTEENGYRYVATVDRRTVEELRNYGSGNLVFVAIPHRAAFGVRYAFSYNVFIRV